MTSKEKARELVDKFCPLVTTWDCYNDSPRDDEDIILEAKQCALIAVDEIINVLPFDNLIYWGEVKQEIEKL
jgi:hypothetical protein